MSSQNKQRNKAAVAKQCSERRKNGGKGPSRTEKKNRKSQSVVWWRKKPGEQKSRTSKTSHTSD